MSIGRKALLLMLACGTLQFAGCASLQDRQPVQVTIAGIEPLRGEGLELRVLVKLRIQNPNDLPLDFNGVSVQMNVQGNHFATGVSDAVGTVPRFGEKIVDVPVSISVLRVARQAIGVMAGDPREKLTYEMTGRLAGPAFNSVRFKSRGEFTLPDEIFERAR